MLEYRLENNNLAYRYTNCIKGFNMPLKVSFSQEQWIKPTEEWQTLKGTEQADNKFSVDVNFYIKTKKVD
jgi:hypothetical protein